MSLTKAVGKEKKNKEELVSINRGDKAIYPQNLIYHSGKSNESKFKVTYEVEVIEVSVDNVKVNAIDFCGEDSTGNDPKNRAGILAFMQGKWIPKAEIELVLDKEKRRDVKLQELLGDENESELN